MDLYDDSFKLQDMIDSDIRSLRTELDELLSSDLPRSPESPTLTALTPVVPMDLLESTLDSELSDDGGTGWMNSSQMYNLSTDLDSIGGLLVNPQTALPVTVIQSHVSTPVVTTISGGMDVTLTPSQTHSTPAAMVTTNSGHTVTLPVQVITTTATLVSQVDQGEPQVNFTVAVPTPSPSPHHVSQQATTAHVHQLLSLQQVPQQQEQESDGSPKPKPKSKLATKIPLQKSQDNAYPKPAYSYSCLIAMALKNSKTGSLPVNEIYDFMTENFPYFKTAPNGWKNSVRHNLSLNKCFEKIEKPAGNGAQRKGYLWAMNPAKVEKMEEELQKWGSKDPVAIRKSMANPERLELIEKGELKNSDSDVKQSEKPVEEKESQVKCAKHSENETAVESLSAELSNSNFSPLGETVSMDSSLPELDLQKGIWENLCEDRLQFLSDSPISSSSPKQSEALCNASVTVDDDSSPVSSPSTLTRSFVHANYIYTYAQCTPQSDSASSHQLLQHSNVTATGTEKSTTICDA